MELEEATPGTQFIRTVTTDDTKDYKREGFVGTISKVEDGKWIVDNEGHSHLMAQCSPKVTSTVSN